MKIKANLHIHTTEDRIEGYVINYDIYQLIDKAAELNFQVLALTCHEKYISRPEYVEYAKNKGILLIAGIELSLNKKIYRRIDVLVLNISQAEAEEAEEINGFRELARFKESHPEVFIIAPHPFYDSLESIGRKKLIKYIKLFDAIEHSWFYSALFNPNIKAEKISRRFNKPFIATSDSHILKYLNTDYIFVETDKLDIKNVLAAIKDNRFINITKPKKFIEMVWFIVSFQVKRILYFPIKFLHDKKYK